MEISVEYTHDDRGNCRVYYKGLGNQKGFVYCLQENTWMFCSRDGEPENPLMNGLKITVHEEDGSVNSIVIGE